MTKLTPEEDFAMCSPEQIAADLRQAEKDAGIVSGKPTISLEDQLRAQVATHEGKIASIVKDAYERPGYYHIGLKNVFSLNPERRAWVKAANEAVRTGQVKRWINGKFYPVNAKTPTAMDVITHFTPLYIALAWFGAFVGMFLVTMTQGPLLIASMGWLGYVCTGAGVLVSFLLAGKFWTYIND